VSTTIPSIPDAATFVQASVIRGAVHAFSTRQGGVSRAPLASLNLGMSVGDDPAAVQENRQRFFGQFGIELQRQVVRVKQVHGDRVLTVDEPLTRRPGFPGSLVDEPAEHDAMVSNVAGLALTVSTADCVPILVHDPVRRAVAAIHAGWRGTAERIAPKAVEVMARRYGTRPADVQVAIGPAIGRCCYQVDRPAFERLVACTPSADRHLEPDGTEHWRADLPGLNRAMLEETGIPASQIEDLTLCTACRKEQFFSHRGEHGRTGRMMSFVLLLPPDRSAPYARCAREGDTLEVER
jgi:YfiH family protein